MAAEFRGISPLTYEEMGIPEWYHHHGWKMRLRELDLITPRLRIEGCAAAVTILSTNTYEKTRLESPWFVDWRVNQCTPTEEIVQGRRRFGNKELTAAFGLTDEQFYTTSWMLNRYQGTTAAQGLFIRFEDYLNIPGPGTGHDGDPNVSILLDREIKKAVQQLLTKG